ncbi:siderophore-interacting protein [Rhodococcus sp. MS16]|uniref:siderophore-interacting protein n=1 Tax=Rhodococcus sp. MS16 TaxID=2579941 RepID=UPI0015627A3E|nr:siderophore-interacting protein [Rhodococcus sp. MS16]NRI66031.1 siderophore-interacting protein [Rhodococcus sp. MS16]
MSDVESAPIDLPSDEAPRHLASVLEATQITPGMRRITFGGAGLADFVSSALPDERVLVRFPLEPPHARSYTVRRWSADTGELDIDFVLHGHGGAARWAETAIPGDTVHLSSANGWFRPPENIEWLTLLADHAALPAVGRILESLPAGISVQLIAQIPDPSEQQSFTTAADADIRWIGDADSLLTELAADPLPPGTGYVWCALEAAAARKVRAYLRHTLKIPVTAMHTMGYWRADKENWERRYALVAERIDEAMGAAMMAGKDFESVRDAVDAAMEREGL